MQTRDKVEGLSNRREFSQPLECLYQDMQTQEKVFYCFYRMTFPRKKAKLSCLELWLKEKFLPVAKSCTRSLHALSVLVVQKKSFPKYAFFTLKMSTQVKNNTACFQRFYKIQPTRKWVNKVNLSSFSTQNLSQFRTCVISARKAKHLDVTTLFTYSRANMPLGQSDCAYCLSYFYKMLYSVWKARKIFLTIICSTRWTCIIHQETHQCHVWLVLFIVWVVSPSLPQRQSQ